MPNNIHFFFCLTKNDKILVWRNINFLLKQFLDVYLFVGNTVNIFFIILSWLYETNFGNLFVVVFFFHFFVAFLPAPLLFGKLIDKACMIWESDCGILGSCQLYDISLIRKLLFIPLISGRFLSLVLILIAFWFAKKTTQPGDVFRTEVQQAMKEKLETTSLWWTQKKPQEFFKLESDIRQWKNNSWDMNSTQMLEFLKKEKKSVLPK